MRNPPCLNCGQRHEGEWCPKRASLAEAIRVEDSKPERQHLAANNADDLQRRLNAALDALHAMVDQYCDSGKKTKAGSPLYNHMHMSAGETACQVLEDEGRITGDQW